MKTLLPVALLLLLATAPSPVLGAPPARLEVPGNPAADEPGDPGFALHEWGTFTTLAGSDGVLLEGVHADDHALPAFVHGRDGSPEGFAGAMVKMETPVIYLYSDREREVRVRVGFPGGLLTTWYPQVRSTLPPIGNEPPPLRDGVLDWGTVKVLAPGIGEERLPAVEPDDPWAFARVPAANVIRVCLVDGNDRSEHERYLFYRGLGRFEMPLRVAVEDGRVVLRGMEKDATAEARVVRVEGGRLRTGLLRPSGPGGDERSLALEDLADATVEDLVPRLADAYACEGLTPAEALAMVRTWEKSWLRSEGTRVLVALPRAATDALLPLAVFPAPRETVRVLVARLDVLTPDEERRAESIARDAASAEDAAARLGRFAIPVLRRVALTARDPETAVRAAELARALEPRR
jgi:hypothetical protein